MTKPRGSKNEQPNGAMSLPATPKTHGSSMEIPHDQSLPPTPNTAADATAATPGNRSSQRAPARVFAVAFAPGPMGIEFQSRSASGSGCVVLRVDRLPSDSSASGQVQPGDRVVSVNGTLLLSCTSVPYFGVFYVFFVLTLNILGGAIRDLILTSLYVKQISSSAGCCLEPSSMSSESTKLAVARWSLSDSRPESQRKQQQHQQ